MSSSENGNIHLMLSLLLLLLKLLVIRYPATFG
jgi:hypothetical protein